MVDGVYFVEIPPELVSGTKTPIKLGIFKGEETVESIKTNFLGPPR
jgi:hypothetical protein